MEGVSSLIFTEQQLFKVMACSEMRALHTRAVRDWSVSKLSGLEASHLAAVGRHLS